MSVSLNLRVSEETALDLDRLALEDSEPGAMLTRSDVARTLIDEGIKTRKKRPKGPLP